MKSRIKTNDQILRNYVKDVTNGDPMMQVILRERLHTIAIVTLQDIENNPSSYDNPIFHHTYYVAWANGVIKAMELNND